MFKRAALPTVLNFSAQIVSMLAFLLMTKIINVEFVGEYLVFLSIATIVSFFSTCFYEQSLYVEHGGFDEKIHNILKLILMTSIIIYLILLIFDVNNAVFVTIFCLGSAIKVISRTIAVVNSEIDKLAICEFLFSPIIPVVILTYYYQFNPPSSNLMVVLNSIATLITGFAYFIIFHDLKKISINKILRGDLFVFLSRYRKNFVMKLPAELINICNLRLPIIIIDTYFSTQMAAYFGVSLRIVLTPVSVFSSTISQIFISNVVKEPNNILAILTRNLIFTTSVSVILCILASVLSEYIIIFLLGKDYYYVSVLIKSFTPYIFTLVAFVPFFTALAVLEKQEYLLKSNFFVLIATFVSYGIGVYINDLSIAVTIFSLSTLIVHGFVIRYIYKVSKNDKRV